MYEIERWTVLTDEGRELGRAKQWVLHGTSKEFGSRLPCTTYGFRVRGWGESMDRGDGSWYGHWSEEVPAKTRCIYADFFVSDSNAISEGCLYVHHGTLKRQTPRPEATPTSGRSIGTTSHTAEAEVYIVAAYRERPTLTPSWCVEGRTTNRSRPGATASAWTAAVHMRQYQWFNVNIMGLAQAITSLNTNRVIAFRQTIVPARTDRAVYSEPLACDSPCKGGTLKLTRIESDPGVIRHDIFHVYGTHRFTHKTSEWHTETHTWFTMPERVWVFDWVPAVLGEIAEDLLEEPMQALRDAVRRLGS